LQEQARILKQKRELQNARDIAAFEMEKLKRARQSVLSQERGTKRQKRAILRQIDDQMAELELGIRKEFQPIIDMEDLEKWAPFHDQLETQIAQDEALAAQGDQAAAARLTYNRQMLQYGNQMVGTGKGLDEVLRALRPEEPKAAKPKPTPASVEAVRGLYGDQSAALYAETGELRAPRGTEINPAKIGAYKAIAEQLSIAYPEWGEVFTAMAEAGIDPMRGATLEQSRQNFQRLNRGPQPSAA